MEATDKSNKQLPQDSPRWVIIHALTLLSDIQDATDGHLDGSPDRSEMSSLANEVSLSADKAAALLRRLIYDGSGAKHPGMS